MSRGSSVAVGALVGVGGLLLVALPVLRIVVLAASLGMSALTALFVAEAMYALARALIPVRAHVRIPLRDAETPGVDLTVLAIETAAAVGAFALLAVTCPWWRPALGISMPWWLLGLVALRRAGLFSLFSFTTLRRPLAGIVGILDILMIIPIVAIAGRSLEVVLAVSVTVTWIFVGLSTMMSPLPATDKSRAEAAEPHDRWQLGTWLTSVASNLTLPLVIAYGGATALVPFEAAFLITTLLWLVFISAAMVKPAQELWPRMLRGIIVASLAVLVVWAIGPWLFRLAFPDSFGDGNVIRILAWGGLSALPLALRPPGAGKPSERRRFVAGAVSVMLALVGAVLYGLPGVLWMLVLRAIATCTITLSDSDTAPHLN